MNKLITSLLLLCFGSANAQAKRPFLPKPPPPEKPEVSKDLFGQWLDKDGYVTDGPKIKNWVDSDRDRVDDRFQSGPGKPSGKKRPDVEKPKPRPIKPAKPNKDNNKPSKPEKPTRPVRSELSDDLKGKMDSYKEEKDKLYKELKESLKKLDKPTRKEVKEAVDAFHKENEDRFDSHKELGKSIKEGLSQNRPERPKKPELSKEIKELHKSHSDKIKQLHESKKKLILSLKSAKGDDRKKLLDSFREGQKSLHEDLKSIQKQLREQISAGKNVSEKTDIAKRPNRKPPPRPESKVKDKESRRPTDR
jgi:hypothetical protein